MDRPARAAARPRERIGSVAQQPLEGYARIGAWHVLEPIEVVAEEPDLINGLIGPRVTQRRWAVGGQHEEWHSILASEAREESVEGFTQASMRAAWGH